MTTTEAIIWNAEEIVAWNSAIDAALAILKAGGYDVDDSANYANIEALKK